MNPPEDCHPKIAGIHRYWRSIHPPDGLPGRRHLDPVDMPPEILPNVMLYDFTRDPLRFRFRLLGTAIPRFAGRDNTSHWCDEAYPEFPGGVSHQALSRVVTEKAPDYRAGAPANVKSREWVKVERLFLPLADNGRDVDMILGLTVFEDTYGQVW